MAPKQQSPKEYEEGGNGKTDNEFQSFSTKIRVRCNKPSKNTKCLKTRLVSFIFFF